MTTADKKALKMIAERYGLVSKGTGLAGKIAGDRMLDRLLQSSVPTASIDKIADAFDHATVGANQEIRLRCRAEFLALVESVAKTTSTN